VRLTLEADHVGVRRAASADQERPGADPADDPTADETVGADR